MCLSLKECTLGYITLKDTERNVIIVKTGHKAMKCQENKTTKRITILKECLKEKDKYTNNIKKEETSSRSKTKKRTKSRCNITLEDKKVQEQHNKR